MKNKFVIAGAALLVAGSVAFGMNATNKADNPCPNTEDCVCCPLTPDCQPGDPQCTYAADCEE